MARSDWHAPVNSGVLLLKPSLQVYALGLGALEAARFDPALGWSEAGRPRQSVALHNLPHAVAERLNHTTDMLRGDHWRFVGADGEQAAALVLFS